MTSSTSSCTCDHNTDSTLTTCWMKLLRHSIMTALDLLNSLALFPAEKVVSVTSAEFLSCCASAGLAKQTKTSGAHHKQTNKSQHLASWVGRLLFSQCLRCYKPLICRKCIRLLKDLIYRGVLCLGIEGGRPWPLTRRTERLCAEECRFHNTPVFFRGDWGPLWSIWWPFVKQSHSLTGGMWALVSMHPTTSNVPSYLPSPS